MEDHSVIEEKCLSVKEKWARNLTGKRPSAIVRVFVGSQVNLFSAFAFTSRQRSASSTAWRWYWRSTEEAIALA
jgi:hypothetical protein